MEKLRQMLIMVHDYICKLDEAKSEKEDKDLFEIALNTTARIIQLRNAGEHVPEEYATAAVNAVRIITIPDISREYKEQYKYRIQQIKKGKIETYESPENKPLTITAPSKKYIPAEPKPKKRAAHIKRGTSELQTEETLNTRILRAIREKPQKNPYKQQHSAYFRQRIEEQSAIMQTPNSNPKKTQEQKDAYYAFQTNTLTLSACAAAKWSGLEKECEKIREELHREPDYDAQKLLEFYGIEMACLKIIKKEQLPDELVKIMHELL